MIKIIDATLAMLDGYSPSKEQILKFCCFMKEIGISDLEISKQVYETLGELPGGFRFYMRLDYLEKESELSGIFKYFVPHGKNASKVISEFQVNDIREIVHLRNHGDIAKARIVGLDDLFCHDYSYVFKEIKKIFQKGEVNFCPEDTFHCATGLAVEWLLSGGREITSSFAGCGGRAATEEVYMAMNVVKRFKPNQSLEVLVKARELFEEITGEKIPQFKPVIGTRIFEVESGIHVDGILKNPANYEAYPPEKVGQKTEIIIGKHSGSNSVFMKCEMLGLKKPGREEAAILLGKIKARSVEKRNSISDCEFLALYKEVAEHEE